MDESHSSPRALPLYGKGRRGHSLGAIICLRALLRAHRKRYENNYEMPWLDRIRLLFFAPAHCGAYVAGIVKASLSRRSWHVLPWGDYALYKSPLLTELSPG